MENQATNIPIWKLLVALQTMMDEGYTLVDVTFYDDKTVSLKGIKESEPEDRPDINRLAI